ENRIVCRIADRAHVGTGTGNDGAVHVSVYVAFDIALVSGAGRRVEERLVLQRIVDVRGSGIEQVAAGRVPAGSAPRVVERLHFDVSLAIDVPGRDVRVPNGQFGRIRVVPIRQPQVRIVRRFLQRLLEVVEVEAMPGKKPWRPVLALPPDLLRDGIRRSHVLDAVEEWDQQRIAAALRVLGDRFLYGAEHGAGTEVAVH